MVSLHPARIYFFTRDASGVQQQTHNKQKKKKKHTRRPTKSTTGHLERFFHRARPEYKMPADYFNEDKLKPSGNSFSNPETT